MTYYKDHEIIKTNTTTSVLIANPGGNLGTYEATRNLYRIEGRYSKEEGKRPLITTIKDAKEYINRRIK